MPSTAATADRPITTTPRSHHDDLADGSTPWRSGDTFGSICREDRRAGRAARGAEPGRQLELAAGRAKAPREVTFRRMRRLRSRGRRRARVRSAAQAARAEPDARAFYVMNAANGEVLASHDAHKSRADRKHHEADDRDRRAAAPEADDVVTVTGDAAQVGESRIPLIAGERITVRDLLKGALIQSANNAADALASAAADGDVARFVAWMNARARALGLRHTHFVRPDGLDAPGHVSSARDVAVLAQVAMHSPVVRDLVRERSDTIENGTFTVHTWNDLLGVFPGLIGVKTGHTATRAGARSRQRDARVHDLRGDPRQPDARPAQRRPERLLAWGVSQYRTLTLVRRAVYAWAAAPFGRRASRSSRRKPLVRVVRVGRPLVERIVAPTAVSLPVQRAAPRAGSRSGPAESSWERGRCWPDAPLRGPGVGGRLRWYVDPDRASPAGASSHDRHRHPQRCSRPHAHRAELPDRASPSSEREPDLCRREGHQRRARAEAPRRAGDRDGTRRRPHGRPDHRRARSRGDPQRLRAHRATSRARRPRSSIRRPAC